MAQIVGCLQGMSEACVALDMPIVSGNVSLYNESKATGGGSAILPTPAIGAVGLLEDWEKSATIGFKAEGDTICLIVVGERCEAATWASPLWLAEIAMSQRRFAAPGRSRHERRRRRPSFVMLIDKGMVTAVHDVSDGGVLGRGRRNGARRRSSAPRCCCRAYQSSG